MFEQRDLAVQTSLIVSATPQSFRPSLSYLMHTGENGSTFQEMNSVTEESLTMPNKNLYHFFPSLPQISF